MRILYPLERVHLVAGATRSVIDTANAVHDYTTIEPIVVGPRSAEESLRDILHCRYIGLGEHEDWVQRIRGRNLPVRGSLLHELRQVIRSERIDLLHLNSMETGMSLIPLAQQTGAMSVYQERGIAGHRAVGRYALRRMARTAGGILVATEEGRRYLSEVGVEASRVDVIPNPVHLAEHAFLDRAQARLAFNFHEEETVIVTIGRPTPAKGLDLAVEALQFLAADASRPIRLIVIAVPSTPQGRVYFEELSRLSVGIAVDSRVQLIDEPCDIGVLLAACDFAWIPSRSESFGRVAVEAMAAGAVTIATSVGALPSVCRDSGTIIVRPECPQDFAIATQSVMDSQDQEYRSRRNRRAARRYAPSRVALELETFYRRLLDST